MKRFIATGVLALVASALAPAPAAFAGGGCAHDTGATVGAGNRIVFQNACMTPTIAWVAPHSTVTWTNSDDMVHNVTGTGFSFTSGDLYTGKAFSFRFDNAGIFAYACTLHPGMAGAVVVGTPVAPSGTVTAPAPAGANVGGVSQPGPPADVPAAASKPVAAKPEPQGGTIALASILAAAIAGAIGFVVGRARRERRTRLQPSPTTLMR